MDPPEFPERVIAYMTQITHMLHIELSASSPGMDSRVTQRFFV